ncbi:F0F1 ATP synthase subunit gamma [bacterium]|nr:F0F1 ATP synthase subunit gamma [bacterium]
MESLQSIKRRMQSVQKTSKITAAMKLVSIVKLKHSRDQFNKIQDYYKEFYSIVSAILNSVEDLTFMNPVDKNAGTMYIVINSSLGLCGAYNNNVNKMINSMLNAKDKLILIGKKAFSYYHNHGRDQQIISQVDLADNQLNLNEVQAIADVALNDYKAGKVSKVVIAYTKFINAMTFEANTVQLLPIDKELMVKKISSKLNLGRVEFLPDENELVSALIPSYLYTFVYGALLESKVCEFASRRNAMDTATNNANDLSEKYLLDFNKMRQAKITEDLIEMMGGGNR